MEEIALSRRFPKVVAVTVAGLVFQLGHLAEHTGQMAMWVLHPQRAPWMSPWAHDLTLWLGGVNLGRSSEVTTEMQRGMELLHLIGNSAFLVGTIGLLLLTRAVSRARSWSRAAFVLQAAHTVEHLALTASLYTTGRAVGLSTGFGQFDGTRLSTYRVWWHGSVNLLASVVCAVAVVHWLASMRAEASEMPRQLSTLRARRALAASTATAFLGLPLLVAFTMGDPIPDRTVPSLHVHAAPVDIDRPGPVGSDALQLVDVAADVGLEVRHSAFRWDVTMDPVAMMGGGVCWIDVDRDGWLDLFLTDTWSNGEWGLWNSTGNLPTTRIYRNTGGVFEEYTTQWGAGFETRANGCVAADLDGDGFTDLYVTTSRENLLLWNDAGTGFVEGAAAAGANAYGWHTGVAAGDIDGDGRIDLVVAGYADLNRSRPDASTGFPNTFEPIGDLVLVNGGNLPAERSTFSSVGSDIGIEPDGPEYGLGVVLVDVDDDGDLDLYVANDTQPNRLYLNRPSSTSGRSFELFDVSATAGADDPNSGMGIATGDLNGDRLPELIVTNLAGQGHAVLLSVADTGIRPRYRSVGSEVGELGRRQTGWGASFGDFDLDGDLDLLIASGQIPIEGIAASGELVTFFSNFAVEGGSDFDDSSNSVGLDKLGRRNGRAVALADYDNDGDLDAVVTAIGQPVALLQNRSAEGHWLMLDFGVPSPGIRARVEFEDGTEINRLVTTGGSWLSSEDPRLHFGLGSHDRVALLEVTRTDGTTLRLENVKADQVVQINEMVPWQG